MNVNAMHRNPATHLETSPAALIRLAVVCGLGAAVMAVVLAGHVPEPAIIVGVILAASVVGWHRTPLTMARVRSHHRFTVVSRRGDGFVTIDSSGVRRVAHHLVADDSGR
jgi:hypothetical protein